MVEPIYCTQFRGPLQQGDITWILDPIMSYINNPEILSHFANFTSKNREEEQAYLERLLTPRAQPADLLFALVDRADHFVGQVGIHQIYWAQNKPLHGRIGIIIHPDYQHQGHAQRGIESVKSYAFDSMAINKLWAMVRPENKRMIRVLNSAGFKFEGRLEQEYLIGDKLYDMHRYRMLKSDWIEQNAEWRRHRFCGW